MQLLGRIFSRKQFEEVIAQRIGQYWRDKLKEGDPDPCICRHTRAQHRQLFADDDGPRGECLICKDCPEFELPLHDNYYESPLTAGTYTRWNPIKKELEEWPVTWKHDRKACRVCNGMCRTIREIS